MIQSLKKWRRKRLLLCLALVAATFLAPQYAPAQEAPAADAPEAVDPAAKKLAAAHGLFQRSLFKLAATQYTEFLKEYPQHAEVNTARYALAVCRYRLGEYEPAIELLAEVLKDPKFEQRDEALAVIAHSHLARENHEKALAAFEELLEKHPQSEHAEVAALNRAQVLYLADKKTESQAAAQAFLQKFPQSPEKPTAMYFLALAQRDLDQPKEAAQTLSALLEAAPESRFSLDATLLLGQCLEATGDLEGAAAQYAKMIENAPVARKPDGQFSLGAVLYKSAQYEQAAEQLSALLKESPNNPYAAPARLQLGLTHLAAGNTAEARKTLTEVVEKDPDRVNEARYGLAQCEIADKKFDAALALLDQMIAAQPAPANIAQVKLDRAVCLMELGQHEPAAVEFGAFVQQHPQAPQVPEALYRQAFCLHKLGQFEQSHALAQQVAKLPESEFTAPTAELDAENLFLLGNYPEAAKAFASLAGATEDEDRKLRFQFRMGQAAYFAADYEEAVKLLTPLAANPKVAQAEELHQALFLLGDALLQQEKNAEAAAALKQFVDVAKGDTLEAQFKLGLAQLRAEKPDEAAQALAKVASGPADSPWVVRAQFEHGQLLYKQGKGDAAAASLAKVAAAADAPEEIAAPAAYLLGWVDFDAKRYPEAAAKWTQLVEKYPKHSLAADAQFQRGAALKEAGQHEAALAALTDYVKQNPEGQHVAQARQLAASSLTALERFDEASAMLAALAGDEKNATDAVLYDLAWSHRAKKDNAAAAQAYRLLLTRFPDSKLAPAAKAELAEFLYADKKYDEAVKLLEDVIADEKAEPKTVAAATYRLGWCYQKLKQPEKAAATFTAFAAKNEKSDLAASALLQAGLSSASTGDLPAATKSLTAMLQQFPQHAQASLALLKLGEVQSEAGNYPASLQTFTQFLEKYPKDKFAYRAQFGIGWAQENQKQYDAARASYQKVIATHNGETAARAQFQIGETYLAEGKFEEAIPALLAVEDVYAYPNWSAKALLEAGRAFEEMKQNDQAKEQYTHLVDKYKDAPEAKLAQQRLGALKGAASAQ